MNEQLALALSIISRRKHPDSLTHSQLVLLGFDEDFLLDVWSFNKAGEKVYPYKGVMGQKRGLYSVNFTNDNNNFIGNRIDEAIKVGLIRGVDLAVDVTLVHEDETAWIPEGALNRMSSHHRGAWQFVFRRFHRRMQRC